MLEVLLNLLILACSSVSYNSTGGYTGITSLGGIYYYQYGGAYSGFDGADGEKAQQLDVQFYQLKLPTVTAAMACSGALMAFCCLLIAMGVLRVPWHCPTWLVVEGLLDVLIAGAYIPALYFYFHNLSAAYASLVCKEREALYQSKGYSGFSCSFHGGDIGAGIFAALGIGVFALGAVQAIRDYQKNLLLSPETRLTHCRKLLSSDVCESFCTNRTLGNTGAFLIFLARPGVIQIVEVILNGMILMCIVASYFVLAGFSASFASGGGFGNNYYSPFEGTELEQVRQLDQQYTVLRAPLIYGGVAVSLGLGVLTLGVLLQGAKSLNKLPRKWLLLEAAFSLLAAVGYCVGIGVYLHAALQINSTDTCRTRERVYARKGLTWMNCQLSGTDGAAATFACLLVIMYGASVVLALRSYREQKHYQDSQEQHRSYSDAPEYLWSGTL
ncbi:MARVEL domain-containing protein 3 [Camelus ferus]|nr:MARVEL domain-containing protein 3 [Camelus ferus]